MTDSGKRRSSGRPPIQDIPDPEDQSLFMPRTPRGHPLDEAMSALQKAIRWAREGEALYWMWELLDGGYAAYFHRRIQIIAAEEVASDIQLGAPVTSEVGGSSPVNPASLSLSESRCSRHGRESVGACRAPVSPPSSSTCQQRGRVAYAPRGS
jgi:hypothetical protein